MRPLAVGRHASTVWVVVAIRHHNACDLVNHPQAQRVSRSVQNSTHSVCNAVLGQFERCWVPTGFVIRELPWRKSASVGKASRGPQS